MIKGKWGIRIKKTNKVTYRKNKNRYLFILFYKIKYDNVKIWKYKIE